MAKTQLPKRVKARKDVKAILTALLTFFASCLLTSAAQITNAPGTNITNCPYDPTSVYEARDVLGWRILVNKKLLAETNLCSQALELLQFQLYQITRAVPAGPLQKLRGIQIWVELNDPQFPCMCYHESIDWLREHAVNPEKTGGVELANAKTFLQWTHDQPWMVMHELAHGYHQQVLHNDARIRTCYQQAKSKGLYDSILRNNGRHERHYAMNNEKEYFAEMTEAFFGTNDFYPFVRAELKEHDPEMFLLLKEVWETK
ncbi:MAG TPA: hypothetical protein VLT36_12295 [Candidatus Dormibacteraeota bacterium]|nr:hypothetical protein [Candidatus Dormibacteraeota bacterium]